MSRLTLVTLAALVCLMCAGCPAPAQKTTAQKTAPPPPQATIPPSVFLDAKPAGAEPLLAVKAKSKVGDEVLFAARVGGRAEPFVRGRAVFLVVDPALPPCAEKEGDGCKTPWDYCCEEPKALLEQAATVQLSDAAGEPLAASAEGAGGLAGLKEVVIEGKVTDKNDAGVFVVAASAVWVAK